MISDKQPADEQGKNDQRQEYETPRLRSIELLPEETLGVGCKLGGDPVCQATFNEGS